MKIFNIAKKYTNMEEISGDITGLSLSTWLSKQPIGNFLRYRIIISDSLKYTKNKQGFNGHVVSSLHATQGEKSSVNHCLSNRRQ
jgi:hypothetical protein